MNIALVSGGFDPVHVAHLSLFKKASEIGFLVVGLNSDAWLKKKKGYIFMPFEERYEIIKEFQCVGRVESFLDDSQGSCIDFLINWVEQRDIYFPGIDLFFCNGGDRKLDSTPEVKFCQENKIELVWNVGGSKTHSSSEMVKKVPK